ncbi:MAG: hypothetical protein JRH20_23925 [Deltaproteobacteria bacterium]|nr:hypothetical protein [Deltaproteobacteria bacterium]
MNLPVPVRVAASEYDLLMLARALVGEISAEMVSPLLAQSCELPAAMGESAAQLLQETLAKGVVRALLRRGGWRRVEHLDDYGGAPRWGRLWERRQAPALHFSAASMRLLRWLRESAAGSTLPADFSPNGWGDEVLCFLACELLGEAGFEARAGALASVTGLGWIACLDQIVLNQQPQHGVPDLRPFFSGDGATVLEGLQPALARRWVQMERAKARITTSTTMIRLGAFQRQSMHAMVQAAREAGRADLLVFLLEAASALLRERPPARRWTAGLEGDAALLSTRTEAAREAGAFLEELAQVVALFDEARAVRFFDDDYERAQLLLRLREQLGDEQDHMHTIIQQLRALDGAVASAPRDEEEPA